jgi:small subunit ribosomal protein S8
MSMTDPIADLLTRIRNAVNVRQRAVDVPLSKTKADILAVLKREGFIEDFKTAEDGARKLVRVYLKYTQLGESAIKEIRRDSKPGRRVYKSVDELRPVLGGIGVAVLSTPRGILSDRECRKERIGGELLCTLW